MTNQIELLRFTTAGSVDDGKSTLIGRLLYDAKAIFEDQMEAVEAASHNRGDETVDLALDGTDRPHLVYFDGSGHPDYEYYLLHAVLTGSGWMKRIDKNEIEGSIKLHLGDRSSFSARRAI